MSTLAHTSPPQFAEIMKLTKPRLAVGYHFYNDFDTLPLQIEMIRKRYDGPLVMALDNMVINVTKDDIKVRRAVIDDEVWPMPPNRPLEPAPKPDMKVMSDFTRSGDVFMEPILREIWDNVNEQFGSKVAFPER